MSQRIACYTLFDITKTGVVNRARPGDDVEDVNEWYHKRNTQSNFDTILQLISLRAQPDVIKDPIRCVESFNNNLGFGKKLLDNNKHPYWVFEFSVQHPGVFENGLTDLGALYESCEGVPMIVCNSNWEKAGNHLDVTLEMKNIYFVKY